MLRTRHAFVGCTALVIALAACRSEELLCPTSAPRLFVEPVGRALAVGERFTPAVTVRICAGARTTPFVGFFRSGNPSVATVDSASGVIYAIAPGQAVIDVHPLPTGLHGSVLVTVR